MTDQELLKLERAALFGLDADTKGEGKAAVEALVAELRRLREAAEEAARYGERGRVLEPRMIAALRGEPESAEEA